MNEFLATVSSLSQEGKFEKLLQKSEAYQKILKKNGATITRVLNEQMLDASQHTLGYLILLHVKATGEIRSHMEYIEQARSLMILGDPDQIKLAPEKFSVVCRQFTMSALIAEQFMLAVGPLRSAVSKVSVHLPNSLTSVHCDFALICLKAGCYSTAKPVLDLNYYEVSRDTGIVPLDYLKFHYYAGMLRIGLKDFVQATEHFQMALTINSQALSSVQVESFKKYVLCSLLVHGELSPLPTATTPTIVSRHVEKLAQPYTNLAKAHKKGPTAMRKVIDEYQEEFDKDLNLGLVKQVSKALVRRTIQRLTNTYVTLSLKDIAQSAKLESPKEAEQIVLQMIRDGAIFAKINQKDGMLSFLEDPEEYDTTAMVQQLDSKIKQVIELSSQLQSVHKQVILHPTYVQKTMPQEKDQKSGAAVETQHMDYEMKMAVEQSLMSH